MSELISHGLIACQCRCCQQWRQSPMLKSFNDIFSSTDAPRPPRISPDLATRIAAEIAADIMRSGCGTEADHLNLYKDGRYLSGWGREPLAKTIAEIIERVGNESV